MRKSSKSRLTTRYYEAMDKLVELDEEAVNLVSDYVDWLQSQNRTKRKTIQVLRVELDELHAGRLS